MTQLTATSPDGSSLGAELLGTSNPSPHGKQALLLLRLERTDRGRALGTEHTVWKYDAKKSRLRQPKQFCSTQKE